MDEILSKKERLNLLNQYTILRDLAEIRNNQDDLDKYDKYITIISNGYVAEYNNLLDELNENFLTQESDLVWNILQIYSNIYFSYKQLKKPTITLDQIKFPGFDGNHEIEYLCFCEFVLNDLDRFSELKENGRTDFNSHYGCYNKYRNICDMWNNMGKPTILTETQIKQLLNL